MANRFDIGSIYEDETWTVIYDNAEGYQEKFYDYIRAEYEKSNFPNVELSVEEYITGGLIFRKEATKMLKVKATQSQFKRFEIFFRAQIFGNVVLFTRMECMERDFFEKVTHSALDLKDRMRKKCKNMAQYEEFVAIDNVANLLFVRALSKMDPNFKERRALYNKR